MIDAHFHCWQMSRADYGWLNPKHNPALKPICRDVTVGEWQAQSAPFGITGGVLVQAAPTEGETYFLLDQADAHTAIVGVVGWVDLLAADAPARIHKLARHPKLKGLRPMLHDLPDPDWILNPALAPALKAMSDAMLVLDALVKPAHLPHILTLAGRYPDLGMVVDHAAKPDIAAGEWQPWAEGIAQIASQTNGMCKLSGLMTEAGPDPGLGALQPYAEHVLKCFGAGRLVWGSDWPVLELACTYADWWRHSQKLLAALNRQEQAAVLGGNAQRLYRLLGLQH